MLFTSAYGCGEFCAFLFRSPLEKLLTCEHVGALANEANNKYTQFIKWL